MKKIIFVLIATLSIACLFAQDRKMSEIKPADLPKETAKWVTANIPGGSIVRAGKIEEKGTVNYVAVVENKGQKRSYIFDKEGKFVGKGDNLLKSAGQQAPKPAVATDPKTQTKNPASGK